MKVLIFAQKLVSHDLNSIQWEIARNLTISFLIIRQFVKKIYFLKNGNRKHSVNTCFSCPVHPSIVSLRLLFFSFLYFISVSKFNWLHLATWIFHLRSVLAVLCTVDGILVIFLGTMRLGYRRDTLEVLGWDHIRKKLFWETSWNTFNLTSVYTYGSLLTINSHFWPEKCWQALLWRFICLKVPLFHNSFIEVS